MVSRLSVAAVAVVLSSFTSSALAQECLGLRSLKYSSTNISLNMRWQQDARGPEGRLITGREHLFGGLRAGLLNIGESNRVYHWGIEFGGSWALGKSVTACPLATYSYQPESTVNFSYPATTELLFGAAIGARPYVTSRVKLIPFAGAGVLRTDFSSAYNPQFDTRDDLAHTGAEVFGGLGVQLGEQTIVRGSARYRDGYGDRSRMIVLG
ncbi:MAG: hypothetical protein H7Z40_14480, partial [Phycisphaerae bacterium]|nr:hypothetical protein [Gemmatimonadaceae bacterium]